MKPLKKEGKKKKPAFLLACLLWLFLLDLNQGPSD